MAVRLLNHKRARCPTLMMPDADKDKKMELIAVLFILAFTLALAYFFGKVALESVMTMMVRGEAVARRVSQPVHFH